MIVILLSLSTALAFGTADFCGGLAAKRTSTLRVVGLAHVIGFVGVLAAAVLIDNVLIWRDVAIGAVGGAFGGIGVALLYRGLAKGPMSVVAPVTAVSSAVVPALWGLATGTRPSVVVLAGLAVALVAIWMVSTTDDRDGLGIGEDISRPMGVAVAEALAAGTGFGLFFILLDMTDPASSPWAVVGARALTGSTLALALLGTEIVSRRRPSQGPLVRWWQGSTLALIALAGVLDTAANMMFLFALEAGSLVVVAILTSLYPIATVALASMVLDESMNSWQRVGFSLAIIATILIALD